jgi:hypothetical protein
MSDIIRMLLCLYYIWPPLWSSVLGYRSGCPGFDSRHYKKKVVGLKRGPLSLVSATEELLGSNSSGSGLESREYGRRDSSRWPHDTLHLQKVGASFTDKQRSLGRHSSLADWGHGGFFLCIIYRLLTSCFCERQSIWHMMFTDISEEYHYLLQNYTVSQPRRHCPPNKMPW